MSSRKLRGGASVDAILLAVIKMATILLNLTITRLLSSHLSKHDYGTYSQILLLVSTLTYLTIFGMVDGVNYFNCSIADPKERESYISTIFSIQCMLSAFCGSVVMLLQKPICGYFDNPDLQKLLIFAASLPLMQNLLCMLHVLLVSVGKARMLAARNLLISLLRLAIIIIVVNWVQNITVILLATLVLDVLQVLVFGYTLRKNKCAIRLKSVNLRITKKILQYCVPMGIFIMINTLNRDLDKYLVAWMTDTETVALYANASKMLPFDIIMASFCTVLQPKLTKHITEGQRGEARKLYRHFIEISYITTTVLCFAVLSAAPQAMELLYTEKYLDGLSVFCVYILVDLLRFSNYTMVLAAARRTKRLMLMGIVAIAANAILNVLLFRLFGIVGPALATLLVTFGLGLSILIFGARELDTNLRGLFDMKFFLLFYGENLLALAVFSALGKWLQGQGMHYFLILVCVCGLYCGIMLLLHGKRLICVLKQVNKTTE